MMISKALNWTFFSVSFVRKNAEVGQKHNISKTLKSTLEYDDDPSEWIS